MKIFKIVFILIFFFSENYSFAQAKKTSDGKEFVYNVSIGAVIGTIGALINKAPEQKFDKVFLKGFYQGAIGGYLTFESKRLVRTAEKNDDWKFFWIAKIVNAGGNSIKENASLNKSFWEDWHINFGFNRIEFHTKDRLRVNYKVLPITFIYTIGVASQTKFEFAKTLKSGEFIFSSESDRFLKTNSGGVTFPGAIVLYTPYKEDLGVLSHEIIHQYQSNDFSQLETFLYRPINSLNERSKTLNKINKYLHYDFRYLPQLLIYSLENKNAYYYYDNYLEREASYYSNTFNEYLLKR